MRIALMGAGGEGGFFGSRLTKEDNDVTLIARGATLNALRTSGLRVKSGMFGDATIPVKATDRPEEVGPVDLAHVLRKDLRPGGSRVADEATTWTKHRCASRNPTG